MIRLNVVFTVSIKDARGMPQRKVLGSGAIEFSDAQDFFRQVDIAKDLLHGYAKYYLDVRGGTETISVEPA